jgi:alpha-N-arabinofuranosidase
MRNIFITFLIIAVVKFSANAQVRITFVRDSGKQVINKHIYGHFAEHLGRCIYDGFYVGENNSQVPNTNGIRNDIVAALRKLRVPNLRWPGGCFADTYRWKDGIGPKKDRPKIVNVWWGGVTEDNSFGTHDFLNMCEMIDAEPYLAANIATSTVQDAADWVNYVNFSGESPMSKLRIQNGREKPWNVKYWGVGNEAWGCGGNMRPEYYSDLYRKFATFMSHGSGPGGIFRIASGANSADYNWTETLMKNIPLHLMEGIALHHYAVIDWSKKGDAVNFDEGEYFTTLQRALFMDSLIDNHSAIMDKYDPQKKVALIVDEWGTWYEVEKGTNPGFLYQQNTMRDAMVAGTTLNIFHKHSDRVRMANLAQTVNVLQAVILTKESKILLTPTYHVMEMYNVHQDATLLPLQFTSPVYRRDGQELPAISASASKDSLGRMHVSLVNIDPKTTHDIVIDVKGNHFKNVSGRILKSANLQDHNTFDQPEKIKPAEFRDAKISNGELRLKVPAASVVVLRVD